MVSFDSLRTGDAGPLSCLCRPKKPQELYALYPFNNNSADLSDHHRDISSSYIAYETRGIWTMAETSSAVSVSIGSLSSYTVDCFVYLKSLDYVNHLESNAWVLRSVYGNSFRIADYPAMNGIFLYNGQSAGTILHVAVAQDAGVLYGWINGVFQGSSNANYNPMTVLKLLPNGSIANLRIVSKCLQKSGSFPVPGTYYTGYEAL